TTFPPHRAFDLPNGMADACRRLVASYGLMFGAIDLIVDATGEYYFLELNPNGQWVWVQQATGLPIREALCRVLRGRSGLSRDSVREG
ncbi:MAG: alpha-L-glutamate ligase, partial [Vicinamibacterales bacterium]